MFTPIPTNTSTWRTTMLTTMFMGIRIASRTAIPVETSRITMQGGGIMIILMTAITARTTMRIRHRTIQP